MSYLPSLRFILFIIVFKQGFSVEEEEVVVRIIGGPQVASLIALELGYNFKGQVRGFPDTYILIPLEDDEYARHQKRGMGSSKRLHMDKRIIWAETQRTYDRQKRDFHLFLGPQPREVQQGRRMNDVNTVYRKPFQPKLDQTFNDELWSQEWYLQDTRTMSDLPKLDLNVLPLFKAGITGKGVRISVLDDGLEHTHDDLKENYDPDISWDCNNDDSNPMPRYDVTRTNSHGTRCAGEVAMMANNKKCGVGIAHNARIGGIKLLDGLVNDRIEATALGYAHDRVDIYSASWGPNDDGKTVDGPGRLTKEALERGINEGRNGKGAIYVWASGNGGSQGDNCNCDGYLNNVYTISVGSASQSGEFPWYGEACASTLAVTYSSGAYTDQMIATTDLHNECTIKHTGTSGSAPLAAGIIALALEVNPLLTWRDIQHLITWTSEPAPVAQNPGWQQNAAGLWFNIRFGFGLMNAHSFVTAASNWTSVPERKACSAIVDMDGPVSFRYKNPFKVEITTDGCRRDYKNHLKYLEHVEVIISINYTIRGVLEIYLTSPQGTKVQLLGSRKLDTSSDGFQNWSFMSVMTWGEKLKGTWVLEVIDNVGPESNTGTVSDITINFYGVLNLPEYLKYGPRNYNHNYNKVVTTKLLNSKLKTIESEIEDNQKYFYDY